MKIIIIYFQELPSFVPQSLTDLVGRKVLFKIKIGSKNQKGSSSPYVVDLVADDADMIVEFEELPIMKVILYYGLIIYTLITLKKMPIVDFCSHLL